MLIDITNFNPPGASDRPHGLGIHFYPTDPPQTRIGFRGIAFLHPHRVAVGFTDKSWRLNIARPTDELP